MGKLDAPGLSLNQILRFKDKFRFLRF